MGVIRVTKFIEEFTVDNFFDSNKQPETSNSITVNPVNNSAESLNIEDVEIINYIENQSEAFIQTDFSSTKEDKVKIAKDILYFDNKQNRFDGYNGIYFGLSKRKDTYNLFIQDSLISPETETVKVTYNKFCQFIFSLNVESFQYSVDSGITGTKYKSTFNIDNHTDKVTHRDKLQFDNLQLFKTDQEHSNYKARLKTAQIYKNDVLVRDYVAAKRKKDNKVGLFDKVENKFYTSPNGTEFIAG